MAATCLPSLLLLLLLALFVKVRGEICVAPLHRKWAAVPGLSDVLTETQRLWSGEAEGKVKCSLLCMQNPRCASFFFWPKNLTCSLHADIFSSEDASWLTLERRAGALYLIPVGVASCGQPPQVPAASQTHDSTLPSGVARYTCLPDFMFFGSSTEHRCTESGLWEGLEGGCERVVWRNLSSLTGPLEVDLPAPITTGFEFKLIAVSGPDTFDIRFLKRGTNNIRVYINPRPQVYPPTVVYDELLHGNWMFYAWFELSDNFPFSAGNSFEFYLTVENNGYRVRILGSTLHEVFLPFISLPRGLDFNQVRVNGDITFEYAEINYT